ncbi:MFS transporter [Canibacter sp. lx-45]|uniref:MFS transporter n=1 Tax=Canibacter zhuwentaonis TaxID=2837491 RepID=UPI001BDD70D7|nr:MFS transporter [Canibacter zhuwentaonis]MBT1034788.1 MFS transporter [Canibacter zhuwentaonis]
MKKPLSAFYPLWLGDSISDVATAAYLFVIPLVAISTYNADDATVGVIMAILSAAPGLLSALLGSVADRKASAISLQLTNLARALLLLFLLISLLNNSLPLPLFIFVAFCVEALSLFYNLVIASLIPRIVPEDSLTKANSLTETAETVTASAGELIGPVLLSRLGFVAVVLLNLISSISNAIGILVMSRRLTKQKISLKVDGEHADTADSTPINKNTLAAAIENLKYVLKVKTLRVLIINALLTNIAIGVVITLLAPYATKQLEMPIAIYGLTSLPGILLSLTAPKAIPYLERHFGSATIIMAANIASAVAVAIIWGAAFFTPVFSFAVLALGLGILDYSVLTAVVVERTIRQKIVPKNKQAGVLGIIQTIILTVIPISALAAGVFSEYGIGRQATVGVAIVFPIIAYLLLHRFIRVNNKKDFFQTN